MKNRENNYSRSRNFALDLGNNNTLICDNSRILIEQPSVIVFNDRSKLVKATGIEAYKMQGKINGSMKAVKPLKSGVIADFGSASQMVKAFVRQAFTNRMPFFGFGFILSAIPFATTEVEKRALRDAIGQFKSQKSFLIYEPVAAAIGNDLDIREPDGKLLMDIGGGITEIVAISLSGIVTSQSLSTAGDTFDEDIQEYFRKNHNMGVSLATAEQIKIQTGAALETIRTEPEPYTVIGKDLITGIPRPIVINHQEVAQILEKSVSRIEQALIKVLEECPPEIAGDIYENGIHLTGGGSLLRGLRERLEKKIKLPVHADPNALHAVSRGIAKVLQQPDKYKAVLI